MLNIQQNRDAFIQDSTTLVSGYSLQAIHIRWNVKQVNMWQPGKQHPGIS